MSIGRLYQWVAIAALGSIILELTAITIRHFFPPSPPPRIQHAFAVLYPSTLPITYEKFDATSAAESYLLSVDGVRVTITEQVYPEAVLYNSITQGFNNSHTVTSRLGTTTVAAAKFPAKGQVTVTQTNGLLLFTQTEATLSDSTWAKLFDMMMVQS